MTLKTYRSLRLTIIAIIAIIFAQSIQRMDFFIPVITLIVSSLILLFMRRKVKDVVTDERDYQTGGRSALLAIQIYSWIAVVSMFLLYSLKAQNPSYEAIAITLAFSTCALILIYSLIFKYYNKIKFTDKRFIYIIFVVIIVLIASLFTLRLFSGEDNWMCKNGQWITHGQPSYPAPEVECK